MIQYKKYYMPGTKEELLKTIDTIDCTYSRWGNGPLCKRKNSFQWSGCSDRYQRNKRVFCH